MIELNGTLTALKKQEFRTIVRRGLHLVNKKESTCGKLFLDTYRGRLIHPIDQEPYSRL
ncbi:hypothetical protein [Bacillus sp. FJAT-45037]|uniref:hypothetical protein n=1 Tax=Bacillus sp. FJAT-45037 TaxID=2011007 RepID=UPI0012FE02BE|nr:hypothetical protein [Bacillus sp. FJAT-45037]